MSTLHFLFDLDGTIADWGLGWDGHLDTHYSNYPNIPRTKDQRSFNLKLNLTPEEVAIVDEVFDFPGFYASLKPIEGAVEAFKRTSESGFKVNIVTTPWWTNKTCLQDKSDWVEKYLGAEARKHIIFTDDKTSIRGDYLIDDKPEITGFYEPTWSQILYDQPYNQEVEGPRIKDWAEWMTFMNVTV